MLKSQIEIFINKKTVQAILKENGYPPNPPGRIHPPKQEPSWKALINNQFVAAIDFKIIIDLWGNAELLSLITAVNVNHMNRLLLQYREYYNTARPHMTNNDFPPDAPEKLPATIPFPKRNVGNVKSVSWVGGFHHSYYWAA